MYCTRPHLEYGQKQDWLDEQTIDEPYCDFDCYNCDRGKCKYDNLPLNETTSKLVAR